jgi:Mce-associated membrane protein
MTKPEDDTATAVDEPTTEASVAPVTKEAAVTESKAEPATVESTTATAAADTVVAPRIRGVAEDEPTDSDELDESTDSDESDESDEEPIEPDAEGRTIDWSRILAFSVLPGLALLLALGAGFLKYVDNSVRNNNLAAIESVQAAKDGTVALLSYKPETVEKQLGDARSLLTGEFEKSYTELTTNVVIPGAKQQQISASARVPAAATVSADPNHAEVLVFVNQTVVVGGGAPSDTASSVKVTLDKVGDKWLISKFDPV